MKKISDLFSEKQSAGKPVISFEFFPPRTEEGERTLLEKVIPQLAALKPDFCSVTYGAGGSTREKTLSIVERIQKQHGLTAMSHLTCVNATRAEIGAVLDDARARGIDNILALRGDPPGGVGEFVKTPGGFEYSSELVAFIREKGDFCIGTAGFPEGHIHCTAGKQQDWIYLRDKIQAGAHFVITQLFFDNRYFFEFYEHLRGRLNVKAPIFPGVLPILSTSQIKKFTQMCGATIPRSLIDALEPLRENDEAATAFGVDFATKQCEELLAAGVPGIHFYSMNKSRSTLRVVRNLGLAPQA